MVYKMPPALPWFNYAGSTAAAEMEWNMEEECPVSKSELELTKIATMTFDCLDCPDLAQADIVGHPQIDTKNLSILSFDTGYLPGGKVLPWPKPQLQALLTMKLIHSQLQLLFKTLRPCACRC